MARHTLAHLTLLSAPPREMIRAAAHAGFDSVGIRICPRRPGDAYPVNVLQDTAEARFLKKMAGDSGVRISNISAYQFYPEVGWDQLAPVVDITAELGGDYIVANCFDADLSRFQDRMGLYCERAAKAGIRIALEFMPYSAIRTPEAAEAFLDALNAPNAGHVVDALHMNRSGSSPADIKALNPSRIFFAQLCDARVLTHPKTDEELMIEARTSRLPLGKGNLPLTSFMGSLPEDTEIEYEVALPTAAENILETATHAHSNLQEFLASLHSH